MTNLGPSDVHQDAIQPIGAVLLRHRGQEGSDKQHAQQKICRQKYPERPHPPSPASDLLPLRILRGRGPSLYGKPSSQCPKCTTCLTSTHSLSASFRVLLETLLKGGCGCCKPKLIRISVLAANLHSEHLATGSGALELFFCRCS